MAQSARQALGVRGEELAVAELRRQGMEVLERNWRCRAGELDVVARDGDALVAVEVKTRRTGAMESPTQAVSPDKCRRVGRVAAAWLV